MVSSEKATFQICCYGLIPGMLEVDFKPLIHLAVTDHTPELKKYVSQPYECKEDQLVTIMMHPWAWEHNGFLYDFVYP